MTKIHYKKRDLKTAGLKLRIAVDKLYLALEGTPDYDEMTEAVSEDFDRIQNEESNPVVRQELKLLAIQAIARQFKVEL